MLEIISSPLATCGHVIDVESANTLDVSVTYFQDRRETRGSRAINSF